jgi:exosortase
MPRYARGLSLAMAATIAALLAVLYYPVVRDLIAQWSIDTTYGYGFFIPFIAAYLLWLRRDQLEKAAPDPSWWGYAFLIIGLTALLVGRVGGVQLIARVSLIPVLFGLVIFLRGAGAARVAMFPLLFLALMIPPPPGVMDRLTWPLQIFTAQFSTGVLRAMGYPVLLSGIYIDLPSIRLEVAQACSGFRSLVAMGATAVLLSVLTQDQMKDRIILVGAVLPVAILANAVRITAIIIWGIYDDPWHSLSGWLVFVVATAFLLWLAGILRQRSLPTMRTSNAMT